MPGAADPWRGFARPRDGLLTLLDLVNEARAAMGAATSAATGGAGQLALAGGGRMQQSALELGPVPRVPGRSRARGSRNLRPTEEPPNRVEPPDTAADALADAGVDDDHVETWRLVRLAQAGDGEAFGLLYDRYFDVVFRFIYFRLNDRTLAEDFTSETFLRALRRIGTISYQGRDIGAWFVTIARNIVLDHLKSARNRLETSTADTVEPSEHAQSTETAVLHSLQSQHLMSAVATLGDDQRECIVLRFVQGMSVSETAAIMGKNDGAIKALQHRAVRKLADLIGDELR